jgi:hypothetical protein
VITTLEAEEELKQRQQQSSLSPDRYYQLLLQVGASEKEADSARANLQLQQMQRTNQWQK